MTHDKKKKKKTYFNDSLFYEPKLLPVICVSGRQDKIKTRESLFVPFIPNQKVWFI